MGLPSPEQLQELSSLVVEEGKRCHGKWSKFKNVLASLVAKVGDKVPGIILNQGTAAAGISSGLSVTVGVTIAPIGAALAPWIGAAHVASQAGRIFALHDLREDAVKSGSHNTHYFCKCGKCAGNIKYIIDKKERNVALIAVGVGTLGVSAIGKAFHSIGKSLHARITSTSRPKELTSKAIVESGREGCTVAMATVFLLSGSWSLMGSAETKTLCQAVAILTSEDGWEKFKSLW